ncbi:MAG: hypothetical protein NVV66_07505 [Cellulomonas sp.]|uniref:hypothetical protein n=1 Tax=Cellulomonas sp. TaxID=40001 RepID=UPI00258F90DE|nr:hypothetical protein [Cellulomonas sp.]MCR6704536.1 hypothetical protein [Cellulomonas sp.]
MTDEPRRGLPPWFTVVTQFVAPATFVSAFLFYYGYAFTRSELWYFGLDVDTIGLSPREFVMRSPKSLAVPLVVLTTLFVTVATVHSRLEVRARHLRATPEGAQRLADRARAAVLAGSGVLGVGVLLLLAYAWWGSWVWLPLVAAAVIAVGAAATAGALRYVRERPAGVVAGLWVLVVAGVLWVVSITAGWAGVGFAQQTARELDELPLVVLDTTTPLRLSDTTIAVEDLCVHDDDPDDGVTPAPDEGCVAAQAPRWRHRGLRLLVQGPDAMFLVPSSWDAGATTVMVPRDLPAQWQFQFVNLPPADAS